MVATRSPAVSTLRADAIRAYNNACAAERAAQEQRTQNSQARANLLLQELLREHLDIEITVRDIEITAEGPRITLDGIEFGLAHDDGDVQDLLIVYQRCHSRRCTSSDPAGKSSVWQPPFAWDPVYSLAGLGQLLAEPWLCGTCRTRAEREAKEVPC